MVCGPIAGGDLLNGSGLRQLPKIVCMGVCVCVREGVGCECEKLSVCVCVWGCKWRGVGVYVC